MGLAWREVRPWISKAGQRNEITPKTSTAHPLPFLCGIDSRGALWCWGDNFYDELGDGALVSNATLAGRVGALTTWASVSAGDGVTCALQTDHSLWCWGDNTNGAVGDGSGVQQNTPQHIGSATWSSVSVGDNHACGIQTSGTNSSLYCWGYNADDELGDGGTTTHTTPEHIGSLTAWSSVTTGDQHTCGIENGSLYCWGTNAYGQLGDSGTSSQHTPEHIGSATTWTSIDAGDSHTCGIQGQALYCWGDNNRGELGIGTSVMQASTPQPVGSSTWASVSAGYLFTCGIQTTGARYCWGDNSYGAYGDGNTTTEATPTPVGSATTWTSVSAGNEFSCGIPNNGSGSDLYCAGCNDEGQLGDGLSMSLTNSSLVQVWYWRVLSAGEYHTCGITSLGNLYCWGDNSMGELGQGNTSSGYTTPTIVGSATDWTSVVTGYDYTCGIQTSGSSSKLYGWGDNDFGQLGLGNTSSGYYSATLVGAATNRNEVTAKGYHSRSTSRPARCWGHNVDGQLGNDPTTNEDAPTPVDFF